ncbi:SEC14-like protein 2 isoform X2 [Daphnia pulicaria]|uniref:SEC14-like protein 2 isoform X2 n=1 Tax=Daphnia pulicaria TaxID=35523 RepID=UPI001EEAA29B|nr:SEC14-like protein 2 isoform X2 [Daphnia pulicaria]
MDLSVELTDSQKTILKQFREVVKDLQLTNSEDAFLARWLIARDFDMPKAEKMLRSSLELRRQYKIDSLLNDFKPPEVLVNYLSAGITGQDKLLNPLWITRYGKTDMKGILRSTKKIDFMMYIIYLIEMGVSQVLSEPNKFKRVPDALVQTTIIFDCDGISMQHVTNKKFIDASIKLAKLYEAIYPEYLHNVFVVNAPKIANILRAIMKPFVPEKTMSKIHMFTHDDKLWKAALLEHINPDQLPVAYGGTLTDPDGNPNCITMVGMGGKVPKSYYFRYKPDTANKKSLSIPKDSKEQLEFPVKQAGALLKWDFHLEEGDIAFTVYRMEGCEFISIVPPNRVDCDMSTEEGEIRCDEPGVYIVEFDNNGNTRSKKIWYAISVTVDSIYPID